MVLGSWAPAPPTCCNTGCMLDRPMALERLAKGTGTNAAPVVAALSNAGAREPVDVLLTVVTMAATDDEWDATAARAAADKGGGTAVFATLLVLPKVKESHHHGAPPHANQFNQITHTGMDAHGLLHDQLHTASCPRASCLSTSSIQRETSQYSASWPPAS